MTMPVWKKVNQRERKCLTIVRFFLLALSVGLMPLVVNAQTPEQFEPPASDQSEVLPPAPTATVAPETPPVTESVSGPDLSETQEPVEAPDPVPTEITPTIEETESKLPATAEPTGEVEPPVPTITWSQPEPVKCTLRGGASAGLEFNESNTYRCEAVAIASSDSEMPADMRIEWIVDVDFPDKYVLGFPQGSRANIVEYVSTGASSSRYEISHPWDATNEQLLVFDVAITRTSCAVGEQVLTVQAQPDIRTTESEAEISRPEGASQPQPARLISPVIVSEGPSISFDGPITFTPVGATTEGLSSQQVRGSATIMVSGGWDPCDTYSINLSGEANVPAETPAILRVVSINAEPVSGDACDLSAACELLVLPQTGNAANPLRYTIGLELQLHELTPVGSFGINLYTEVSGGGPNP